MAEEQIKYVKSKDFAELKGAIAKVLERLPSRDKVHFEELDARVLKLEKAIAEGQVTPQPKLPKAVESGAFLRSLTSAFTQVQAELLAEAGPVRYAIGPVKARISANLETDAKGQVKLHLPPPGVRVHEATLAQLDFSLLPVAEAEAADTDEEILVPSVIGQPLALARKQLAASGLTAGEVTHHDSDGPEDRVLEQSPGAGATLLAGSGVDLIVSQSVLVEAPNVVGGDAPLVAKSLAERGLRYRTTRRPTDEVPEGTVLEQAPEAGSLVERRSVIKLTVATSPPPADDAGGPAAHGRRRGRSTRVRKKRSS